MFCADCYTILLVYSVYRKRNILKKVLIVSCVLVVFYAFFVVVYVCFSFFVLLLLLLLLLPIHVLYKCILNYIYFFQNRNNKPLIISVVFVSEEYIISDDL